MDALIHPLSGAPTSSEAPSEWVVRWAGNVSRGARVLDFAAGGGRHARWLARRGLDVVAADRDAGALAQIGGGVETCEIDLETAPWPWPDDSFAAVIVTRYLYRPRLAALASLLTPGGLLIYETFLSGQEQFGRPTNPDFLLQHGELRRVFSPYLTVLDFEEGRYGDAPPVMLQRLCACR